VLQRPAVEALAARPQPLRPTDREPIRTRAPLAFRCAALVGSVRGVSLTIRDAVRIMAAIASRLGHRRAPFAAMPRWSSGAGSRSVGLLRPLASAVH